jgi:ATP synthase protein I
MTSKRPSGIQRPPVQRLMVLQSSVALLISAAFLMKDTIAGYSALLGAVAAVLPSFYFTLKAFALTGARSTPRMVSAMQKGAGGKLILTAVIFMAVFIFVKPINITALIFTFVVMVLVNATAPWLVSRASQR